MIFLLELLGLTIGGSAISSRFDGKFMDEDKFQNYGGKEQRVYR